MPVGEAVLSAFMQALFEKVMSAAFDQLTFPQDVAGDLQNLSSTLSMIQALIEDAEERQLKNKAVRSWLAKLKDVTYEMEDLLNEYAAEALQSKLEGSSNNHHLKKVRNYLCCLFLNNSLFNCKIAKQIKKIEEKLDRLVKEREIIGPNIIGGMNRQEIIERPKTSSLVDDLSVFGRAEDRENIVNMLLTPNNLIHANLSILPIMGIGGLGKTTLTQLVYNDERVKEQFPLRIWVCVSENFDETKLTKETIESVASGLSSATTNMNLLQEELANKLKGKRFLLVLDDVWNEDPDKWDRYRRALVAGKRGSKIIVTTQNENVGKIMGSATPYYLKQLSDDDCWHLFRNYAFVDGDSSAHLNLEKIGKEIVKKLKGLPLAAKALGSLLYAKENEDDWRDILKSEIWALPSDRNNILPALRLSYNHLLAHLKRCFSFCLVFHKDYVFEKDKLVQIWMALGFIQPQGRRRIEEIGSSYFDDLLSRFFFQHQQSKYVMHDAIHDLAQIVSNDECIRLEDVTRSSNPARRARHISFSCDNRSRTTFEAFHDFKRSRALLLLNGYKSMTSSIPSDLFFNLRYLHVLDLNRRDITELPDSIGNLKMLRYLNLSGTGIRKLPSSISLLYSLQTLKLRNYHMLDEIPKGVTNLVNLRHLEASARLITEVAGIGNLTGLQELEEFLVHKDKGYKISELKARTGLRGRLCITHLENVTSREEASEALLSEKPCINILDLVWSNGRHLTSEEVDQDMQILNILRPYDELKELTIKGFAGYNFPNWLENVSHLQTIHLSDCSRSSVLPSLGQLPLLKFLDIGGFPAVVQISQEFSGNGEVKGFPSLNELVFEDMSNLEIWNSIEDGELLPRLTDLQVVDCPKVRELPLLPPTLVKLKIFEAGLAILPDFHAPSSQLSSSLAFLEIHQCPNLTSLQQGLLGQRLMALQQLTITNCPELIHLPIEGFSALAALKSLHIYDCLRLAPSGQQSLLPSMLEDLRISSCSNLINPLLTELKKLSSLTHLVISECDSICSFPEEELPATLQVLEIVHCSNLGCLPADLGELSSLTAITILKCPQIPCLPGSGLPITLKELYIKECPLLTDSCQENGGRDWPKIAHIPVIEIDEDGIMPDRRIRRRR